MSSKKKGSLLYILKILVDYTDGEHYITYIEISKRLEEEYGICLERKAVADSINVLTDYGYDIGKKTNGKGVALISREFDSSQVTFLVDSVYSSKNIPSNNAKEIIGSLLATESIYRRNRFQHLTKAETVTRSVNQEFFLNVEKISEAIDRRKKIQFKYCEYGENGELQPREKTYYPTNPRYLVNSNGTYYLLCDYDTHDTIVIYKVNQIKSLEILENRDILPQSQSKAFGPDFDIADYLNEHIYLFGGKCVDAKFKIAAGNSKALTYVFEWFGQSASVSRDGRNDFIVTVHVNEDAFFFWSMQYLENIVVLEPQSVRDKIRRNCLRAVNLYTEGN